MHSELWVAEACLPSALKDALLHIEAAMKGVSFVLMAYHPFLCRHLRDNTVCHPTVEPC